MDRYVIRCCRGSVVGFKEGRLLGRVGGDDRIKVEFGADHLAMVSWVDWRQRDPLGGLQTSATGLPPLHPLLLESWDTLKFLQKPYTFFYKKILFI